MNLNLYKSDKTKLKIWRIVERLVYEMWIELKLWIVLNAWTLTAKTPFPEKV